MPRVEVQIAVDRPFVPANVSPGSEDTRELGIRVYRAAVERLPNVLANLSCQRRVSETTLTDAQLPVSSAGCRASGAAARLCSSDRSLLSPGPHQRDLAARAVPVPRLLALLDVLPEPVQTCGNKAASAL